jgi:hypothetical protein
MFDFSENSKTIHMFGIVCLKDTNFRIYKFVQNERNTGFVV